MLFCPARVTFPARTARGSTSGTRTGSASVAGFRQEQRAVDFVQINRLSDEQNQAVFLLSNAASKCYDPDPDFREVPHPMPNLTLDGKAYTFPDGERLLDTLNRLNCKVPHVCYHPQLGPIETCDTCMVEVDGKLVRACATVASDGMTVMTASPRAASAQREAFDRILSNHFLYCTVCDNNNGNCTVHNTTATLGVEHQQIPFKAKPYTVDATNPFYRYDPDQCILCGRCVEACQNLQVNETLSIRWEDPNPRVLWDGGAAIGESSCVSCGHCVTVCPCNALMEKSMLGEAGYFTALPAPAIESMIAVVKGIEPEVG